MLNDGIWPRFSEEEFSWIERTREFYIAFPIVCFCNIPTSAANHHRQKYGYYAVAIHKNYTTELDITPVWYIWADGSYADELRKRFPRGTRFTLQGARGCDLFHFLPLMKTAIGTQPLRGRDGSDGHEAMDFTEECEWRHIPKASPSDDWRQRYRRGFTTDADHQKTKAMKIKLRPEMVEAIYVRTVKDVRSFRHDFPLYRSRIHQWPTKK